MSERLWKARAAADSIYLGAFAGSLTFFVMEAFWPYRSWWSLAGGALGPIVLWCAWLVLRNRARKIAAEEGQ